MKHLLATYILVFISFLSTNAQTTKKVLFLGNSYTAFNNLPSMVNSMAGSTGDILIYDSYTPGGYTLMGHTTNTTTVDKINSNNWDYVTLQAQSQETSQEETQMETNLYPYAESLSNTIRANNECSQPMFYMTWGRENGDAGNCNERPWVCTYEGMDDAIRATYVSLADDNDTEIAPVGAVWRHIRTNHPNLDLYSNDGSHPSLTGSYAAACAFYTMIYKKDPTMISWNSSLPETDANIIKMTAKAIVYDDISNWDFTISPAMSNYTESINAGEIEFTNTSNDYDSLLWDFGDTNTSTEANPTHTYLTSGTYTVSLTTTKCEKSHTKTKTLNIDVNLSTEEFNIQTFIVSPNPTSKDLNIKLNKTYKAIKIYVFDIKGKSIIKRTVNDSAILNVDVSTLSNGMYILNIYADTDFYSAKISKK